MEESTFLLKELIDFGNRKEVVDSITLDLASFLTLAHYSFYKQTVELWLRQHVENMLTEQVKA